MIPLLITHSTRFKINIDNATPVLYCQRKEEITMAISKLKRRYSVTLTPSIVSRFQALAKELGMPPSVMSAAFDDTLKGLIDVFQTAKEKGSLDLSDMKRLMGEQLELVEREENTDEKRPQEAKKVDKKPVRRSTRT
jgi:hypothetical protein